MEKILEQIYKANGIQIEILLDAVLARYRELYPGWDIGTVFVRKSNDVEGEINRSISMMESLKIITQKQEGNSQELICGMGDNAPLRFVK